MTDERAGGPDVQVDPSALEGLFETWERFADRRYRLDANLAQSLTPELLAALVWRASGGSTMDVDVLAATPSPAPAGIRSEWCATLGRALVAHRMHLDAAVVLLERSLESLPRGPELEHTRLALAGALLTTGDLARAGEVAGHVVPQDAGSALPLLCDVAMTQARADGSALHEAWQGAADQVYGAFGIAAPVLTESAPRAALGIAPPPMAQEQGGARVSIILTSSGDDPERLAWVLRSACQQTWRDLEVVLVDVSTNGAAAAVASQLEASASQVRVIAAPSASPASAAREALSGVDSTYVAWHDDESWFHPDMTARQVQVMEREDDAVLARLLSWHITANLESWDPSRRGCRPVWQGCLMRRVDVVAAGGFAEAGVHAHRATASRVAGGEDLAEAQPVVEAPLMLTLVAPAPREAWWHVPASELAREASWACWARAMEIERGQSESDPVAESSLLRAVAETGDADSAVDVDVLMVGDWFSYGGPQKSMLSEIEACVRAGRSVAIMHLFPPRFFGTSKTSYHPAVIDLVLDGTATLVVPGQRVNADIAVVRYPPIFAFGGRPLPVHARRVLMVANQAPSERDGSDVRYAVRDVREALVQTFGRPAVWSPQGPEVRRAIAPHLPPGELFEHDTPGVIDAEAWAIERTRPHHGPPVVGRHSRDDHMKWPETRARLLAAYPDSDDVDVRVMGGVRAPRKVLGGAIPRPWLILARDAMPVRDFLASIDYFVYFQHSEAIDAFGRSMLEAIAAGCVVILPPHMREVFGDGALYCEPEDSMSLVRELHADPARFRAQSERALAEVRRRFSLESHVARLDSVPEVPTRVASELSRDTPDLADIGPSHGFVLDLDREEVPHGYVRVDHVAGLSVDRGARVDAAIVDDHAVVVLGIAFDPEAQGAPGAAFLAEKLARSESEMLAVLDRLVGRYAIIWRARGATSVAADATSMKAVFYSARGRLAASHALVVATRLGVEDRRDALPFNYGYPGDGTPFPGVRILTPNMLLRVESGELARLWPHGEIPPRQVDDVASQMLRTGIDTLQWASGQRDVRVALTAGLDSRVLLATVLASGIPFETYTYDGGAKTGIDAQVAQHLARVHGFRHTRVLMRAADPMTARHMNDVHYSLHHPGAVWPLQRWFGQSRDFAVSANLLEIGRNFYKPYRDELEPPVTGEAMRALHERSMHSRRRAYGGSAVRGVARGEFERWIGSTSMERAWAEADPFDVFYWEHRMATWHGAAMNERDLYAEALIPFNQRAIFEAMLGLDSSARDRGDVFTRLIELAAPQLLDTPINPKTWPLETP